MPENQSVKILVIEANKIFRKIIADALGAIEFVRVVGHVATCENALKLMTSCLPNIVILDYDMAPNDIKKAIADIKKINEDIEIILSSESRRTSSASSFRALQLGALYFIRKPSDNTTNENIQYFSKYLRPIIRLFIVNQIAGTAQKSSTESESPISIIPSPSKAEDRAVSDFEILAIGCSLGGPEALKRLIPLLPGNFPIPTVVTQHMPKGFTAILSGELDAKSKLIVIEGRSGMRLQPGYVYIAPGGKHMTIGKEISGAINPYIIVLNDESPVHNCRPAVDVMFESLVKNVSGNVLAVILTGMGHDGLAGIRALKEKGNCFCMTQDRASSVVFGMPRAIAEAGLSDLSLPLDSMAKRIMHLVCENTSMILSDK